jgi:3-methyladenine DNA glycosylase/8-oxoguanine DNA glycosylase
VNGFLNVCERRVELESRWPLRLPSGGADGVARRRGGVLERLLHVDDRPVVVRAAQSAARTVLIGARGGSRGVCELALARMRFALGVDDDLAPFHRRFRGDPLIGPSLRWAPWLRPSRRPEPFEALAWAICEQLIEYARATGIERRIVRRLGRGAPGTTLRDLPSPAALAGTAPALLESFDLSAGRAIALRRSAGEVASGRIDLGVDDHEQGWRALRAIPGIGSWTVECLGLHGQGRLDQVPAGDLALRKVVRRLRTGDPQARAHEDEVREFFAPYAPWGGLAAAHALRHPGLPRPARAGRSSGSVGDCGAHPASDGAAGNVRYLRP